MLWRIWIGSAAVAVQPVSKEKAPVEVPASTQPLVPRLNSIFAPATLRPV
jgi:hypothetical protein